MELTPVSTKAAEGYFSPDSTMLLARRTLFHRNEERFSCDPSLNMWEFPHTS